MFVDAAFTSPQREPSGILNRCSPRLRKTAFCCSVNLRPCCRSSCSVDYWRFEITINTVWSPVPMVMARLLLGSRKTEPRRRPELSNLSVSGH
jgi:hypothetical protein